MTVQWNFAYLLPHALFKAPIERGSLALVPPGDARLVDLARNNPCVAKLTSAFTDQFGLPIQPSAILIRSDAPKSVDFYAIASFRNVIAISSMIDAWGYQLSGGNAGYPLWADYFDFYPFTVTKDGDLMASSVPSTEINLPDEFSGQRAPHLPSNGRLSFGHDQLVLDSCLAQWDRKFIQNRAEWKTRVLFRSLEIACQAMRVPAVGTRTPTIHDIGVGIALWVSAFEILSHPKTGNANLGTVLDLLSTADWADSKLRATRFKVEYPRNNIRRINLVQKFYHELYRSRNAFLHGNPVTPSKLFPLRRMGCPTLLHCAPLIFRAALLEYVPVKRRGNGKVTLATKVADWMTVTRVQSRFEKALLKCKPKKT